MLLWDHNIVIEIEYKCKVEHVLIYEIHVNMWLLQPTSRWDSESKINKPKRVRLKGENMWLQYYLFSLFIFFYFFGVDKGVALAPTYPHLLAVAKEAM